MTNMAADYNALVAISKKLEEALSRLQASGGEAVPQDFFELDFGGGEGTVPTGTSPSVLPSESARKVTETQRLLAGALRKMSACDDEDDLLEAIMDALIAVSGAERGFLMSVDEGKLEMKVGRAMGQSLQSDAELSRSIVTRVLRSREPCHIPDTSKEAELSSSIQGLRLMSIISVPLIVGTRSEEPELKGVVYLDSQAVVKRMNEADFEMVVALAEQAAITLESLEHIENAQALEGDAEHYKKNLTKLLEVSRMISSTLEIEALLEVIVDKALEVSNADRGYIMLFEEGELRFKVGRAWNKKFGDKRKSMSLNENQFFFSRSITGQAFETKKSVCITDALGGGDADPSVSIVQMELQTVMCSPLLDGEQVIGLVYVDSKAKNHREFNESDLELFEGLAGQASIALKNALLYAQVGEQQRMAGELDIAARIQQDLLPERVPAIEGLELAGMMSAAKEVGGDYYDYLECIRQPGQALDIVVGDVSGKGLGAGIVAVMARCHLRSMLTAYGGQSPHNILSFLNGVLSGELKPGQFMTMILFHYDVPSRSLVYASAGHEHIIHWHKATGKAEAIRSGGTALGIIATALPTPDTPLHMQPGDLAILYTDGVTEAMDENEEEWGMERLLALTEANAHLSPKEFLDVLDKDLTQFRGNADQSDDITVVCLRKL